MCHAICPCHRRTGKRQISMNGFCQVVSLKGVPSIKAKDNVKKKVMDEARVMTSTGV